MIVECKLYCCGTSEEEESLTGKKVDEWLPFMFDMADVVQCKMADDTPDDPCFNKSEIFMSNHDNRFVIDIEWAVFRQMFRKYKTEHFSFISKIPKQ